MAILHYKRVAIKTLGIPYVSTIFWVILREGSSTFV